MVGCRHESVDKTSLFGRTRGRPSTTRKVLPSASDHLPRVGLFEPKYARNVAVRIIERFPKNEGRSFGRGQRFQQNQNPKRQRLASFSAQWRTDAHVDWFRQPRPYGRFSA